MSELNVREERFCLALANTGDKYKSFEIAGYEGKTHNSKAACVSRLLKRPEIKQRISEFTDELLLAQGVTEDRITANLADIAFDKANCKSDRTRALEILAKTKSMLTENINTTDTQHQRELDEKASEEAEEFARWRLASKYGLKQDVKAG